MTAPSPDAVPPQTSDPTLASSPPDSASRSAGPWLRWFARIWLDYVFVGMILGMIWAIAAPESEFLKSNYLLAWVAALVWIPLEAACLVVTGTTPGKFLLGLQVLTRSGRPITSQQALSRAISVWIRGCAMLLPLVPLFTFNAEYNRLKAGKEATWDEAAGLTVTASPLSIGRKLLLVAVALGLVGLMMLGATAE